MFINAMDSAKDEKTEFLYGLEQFTVNLAASFAGASAGSCRKSMPRRGESRGRVQRRVRRGGLPPMTTRLWSRGRREAEEERQSEARTGKRTKMNPVPRWSPALPAGGGKLGRKEKLMQERKTRKKGEVLMEEEKRATEARELASNKLLREVFDTLRTSCVHRWEVSALPEEREEIWRTLKNLRAIQTEIMEPIRKMAMKEETRDCENRRFLSEARGFSNE